ncbi:MAG: citramalate synthase [Planctomycetes bacterium]|nr:citramalate synthase [Planctomycetota bacterium]
MNSFIEIYDTTLRDGTQGEGVSFSQADKLSLLRCFDDFRIDYVEGGWPGSNPKDIEFFKAAQRLTLKHTKLAAFGSTCRAGTAPASDPNLQALLEVETPVVTIFGKSWKLHVTEVFKTTIEENLRMIEESVAFLQSHGREVIYDAEHFFDGFKDDPDYALKTLAAAVRGGCSCLVLCDTNGGTLLTELGEIVQKVKTAHPEAKIGIHTHNDSGIAVANALHAVELGARHVQGTFNGLGERCGNADLTVIIANLILKLDKTLSIPCEQLTKLTHAARYVHALANIVYPENEPYVGQMAFAHKGGVHVNSVMKVAESYEHVSPEAVGNTRRVLISELSGKSNAQHLAVAQGIDTSNNPEAVQLAVKEIKRLENKGYVFETAEASATLIVLKHLGKLPEVFELVRYRTSVEHRASGGTFTEATVKIRVQGEKHLAVGEGVGPVDALDTALRTAMREFYPEIDSIVLNDYRVRIINAEDATHAKVCVTIQTMDKRDDAIWGSVGASENIIEASWAALRDSIVYGLLRRKLHLGSYPDQDAVEPAAASS